MKKLVVASCLIITSLRIFAQQKPDSNLLAIKKVVNTFMQSIIKKDTATLSALFAKNIPVGWVDIQSKETLEAAKKNDPAATMIESDDYKNFIGFIGRSKNAMEEKFYNIKIRHDALLASVSFDYSFWINGKKQNWGQENWEMVHDGTEWKIAGVYFSYTFENIIKEPANKIE